MSAFIRTQFRTSPRSRLLFRQTMTDINRRRYHHHHSSARTRTSISTSSSPRGCTFSTDITTIATTEDKFHEEVIRIVKESNISFISFGDIDESIYNDTIIPKFKGGMLYKKNRIRKRS